MKSSGKYCKNHFYSEAYLNHRVRYILRIIQNFIKPASTKFGGLYFSQSPNIAQNADITRFPDQIPYKLNLPKL